MLALTSNKEGAEVQHATAADGGTVAGTMLGHLRALNAGAVPLGSFGAVVGATVGEPAEDFAINGPLLAPGYGAQGGTVADLRRIFGACGRQRPAQLEPRAAPAGSRRPRPRGGERDVPTTSVVRLAGRDGLLAPPALQVPESIN